MSEQSTMVLQKIEAIRRHPAPRTKDLVGEAAYGVVFSARAAGDYLRLDDWKQFIDERTLGSITAVWEELWDLQELIARLEHSDQHAGLMKVRLPASVSNDASDKYVAAACLGLELTTAVLREAASSIICLTRCHATLRKKWRLGSLTWRGHSGPVLPGRCCPIFRRKKRRTAAELWISCDYLLRLPAHYPLFQGAQLKPDDFKHPTILFRREQHV